MNAKIHPHRLCMASIDRGSGIAFACDTCWSMLLDPRGLRVHRPWGVIV